MDIIEKPHTNYQKKTLGRLIDSQYLYAAKDERLSVAMKLISKKDQCFSIKIDGFYTNDSKHQPLIISKLNYVIYWYQASGAWDQWWIGEKKQEKLVPELLVNDYKLIKTNHKLKNNSIKINKAYIPLNKYKGKTEVESKLFPIKDSDTFKDSCFQGGSPIFLWITINISQNIQSGIYHGYITVESKVKKQQVNRISLHVLDFTLPKSDYLHGLYYRGKLTKENNDWISSDLKSKDQLSADFSDIYDHGINTLLVYQPLRAKYFHKNYSKDDLDKLLNDYLKIKRKYDGDDNKIIYLDLTTDTAYLKNINLFDDHIKNLKKHASIHGYKDVYIYGIDEAKGKQLDDQKQLWSIAHNHGVKIIAAGKKDLYENMYDYVDAFIVQNKTSLKRKGDKLLLEYSNPQSAVENPYQYRYQRGLRLWQNNYDGSIDYAYQHSMGFAWDDNDHKTYRDHMMTYPSMKKPISTIAWEGLSLGITDLRYISKLETCLINKDKSKAKEFLSKLKINKKPDFEEFRKKIIKHIKENCGLIK